MIIIQVKKSLLSEYNRFQCVDTFIRLPGPQLDPEPVAQPEEGWTQVGLW